MILRGLWILVLAHIALTWALAIRRGWRARRNEVNSPPPRREDLPPVSVLVPAWNEKGTIEKHIAALRQVEYPRWEAIILAGGDDGTHSAAMAAAMGDERLRVLERGPEPKNAALNRGVQEAQYDIVVLLDCDNIVEPGWLAALMAPIARGASVAVGDGFPNRITPVTLEETMWNIHTYQIQKLSWIQGDRSIAIRRDLLARIGGLPEHTYAREDWDIWARLGDTGERVAFAEGARLTTDRPATVRESWRHHLRWRRTHLTGLWEHRATLLNQPRDLFAQLYAYLLAAGLAFYLLLTGIAALVRPDWAAAMLSLLAPFLAWLCGRTAALAGAVAAYTGDWRWLARAWMPALNLFLTIPASFVALLTPRSAPPLYKGPRNSRSAAAGGPAT
ncbi:MAG: glycosyltransferase family 2 protein [Anaerolineaceae bacterium]|nr:glycosyltransferase family 2 protein [Anaerolineaceae bacterium]